MVGDTEMGTHFFHGNAPSIKPNSTNLEARALGAPSYGGMRSAGAAAKDIGAAQGINRAGVLKPIAKTAATDAPGPKV